MEKKNNISSKKIVFYLGLLVLAVTVLGLFVSYGYAVYVKAENQKVGVETANNLKLIYKDCENSNNVECANIEKDLEPGESVEKIFEVTNSSDRDLSFNLYFKELYNSFSNDDLVYTLENMTTNEVLIGETPVRFSELKLYDLPLKRDIGIGANSTNQYKLTVKFLNRDVNQNYNKDASYSLKLTIGEYKREGIVPKIVASIMDNTALPKDEFLKVNETPDFGKASPMATEYIEVHENYTQDVELKYLNSDIAVYADSYNFDNKTGKYILVNPQTCRYSECLETIKGKYSIHPYEWGDIQDRPDTDMSRGLNLGSSSEPETENLDRIIKIGNYSTKDIVKYNYYRSTFKSFESQDGIYAKEDDYGTSYYFRGTGQNNYVKFGGYYWRIIRINGDGSLRIIFDGNRAHHTGDFNGIADRIAFESAFNENGGDAKYVGYMYGPVGTAPSTSKEEAQSNIESSTIKTKLEEWYVNKIKNKGLDQYVADSIFCNDRSIPGKELTGVAWDTGKGFGLNYTVYGAFGRFVNATELGWSHKDENPIFTCPQKNDAFTVNDNEKGNGALSEKVGLVTADEIVAAGNILYEYNPYNYLSNGYGGTWLLSPYSFFFNNSRVFRGGVQLNYYNVNYIGGVAPVINLTPEYARTLIGTGEIGDEYEAK